MAAGTAAGAKTLLGKLLWTAAIAVVTAGTIIYYASQEDKKEILPSENKEVSTLQNSAVSSNTPESETNTPTIAPAEAAVVQQEIPRRSNTTVVQIVDIDTDPFPEGESDYDLSEVPPSSASDNRNDSFESPQATSGSENNNETNAGTTASDSEKVTSEFSSIKVPNVERRFFFIPVCNKCGKKIWNMGDGSEEIESDSPAHTYNEEGEYTVELRILDNQGKTVASSTNKIQVYKPGEIVLPNIFTPNGTGGNDYFDYKAKSSNVQFELIQIWDSNSQLVFENNGSQLWDGTNKSGNPCPDGLYRVHVVGSDKYGQKLEKNATLTIRR